MEIHVKQNYFSKPPIKLETNIISVWCESMNVIREKGRLAQMYTKMEMEQT